MPLGAFKAALMGTAGVSTADVVLLSTQTASDSAALSFTSDITSTYGEYIFKFYNINPATDSTDFQFQVNATDDPGGDYDTSLITSTFFLANHAESDDAPDFGYSTSLDQAQGAAYQSLNYNLGNAADASLAGELHLFNPSSTTYVKHFIAKTHQMLEADFATHSFIAGYINDATAIDDIQFKMSSGNINAGTIKMWGVK